jgi:hypothetical protein
MAAYADTVNRLRWLMDAIENHLKAFPMVLRSTSAWPEKPTVATGYN